MQPVPGYDSLYCVDETGAVWSTRRGGRWLRPRRHQNGYVSVLLTDERGSRKTHLIHRLVLLTFDPHGVKAHAEHLNGQRDDNRLENLRWATVSENNLRKNAHGTMYRGGSFTRADPQ